jgi:hypothetical protein
MYSPVMSMATVPFFPRRKLVLRPRGGKRGY